MHGGTATPKMQENVETSTFGMFCILAAERFLDVVKSDKPLPANPDDTKHMSCKGFSVAKTHFVHRGTGVSQNVKATP